MPAIHITTRRAALVAALACVSSLGSSRATAQETDAFARCLNNLHTRAKAARITDSVWRQTMRDVTADPRILRSLNVQPEQQLSIWDYIAATVDDERIREGRQLLQTHDRLLRDIEAKYGVDPATLVALWGLESNFGKGRGSYELIRSLTTLSCEGRRQSYFRSELFAALRMIQAGHASPALRGSWAGAFGHVQFMPSTFEWQAVDFDGDGRRDLMESVPDALASAARFLKTAGWRTGQPWGIEVRLPQTGRGTYDISREGRRVKRPLSQWATRGFVRVDGSALISGTLSAATSAALIAPAGPSGPVFLVLRNYDAIFRYNAAQSYTVAIAHLADRLRGGGPFVTRWPTSDLGLSRAERREMQRLLAERGHDIGEPTGVLTAATRAAIRVEQDRLGLEVDGRPGQRLLAALRER